MPRTMLLLAAALCAAVPSLAGPQWCRGAGPSNAEQKIEVTLLSPTQLDFIETPLQDVVDYLKDYHRIEIQIDRKACNEAGLDPSTMPLTKNLKGISLRSALNLVLGDHELTYLIQDEVLLITTLKDAAGRLTTKVYPVDDVVGAGKRSDDGPPPRDVLIQVIVTTVAPRSWTNGPAAPRGAMGGYGGGGFGGGGFGRGGLGGGQFGGGGMEYDGHALAPLKKAGPAARGSIAGASFGGRETLIVSQTYRVHRQIAALLEELRNVASAKRPAPAKPPQKAAAAKPAKSPAKRPAAASPAKPPSKPPVADPFGGEPATKPPVKRSAPTGDDPFGR